MVIEGVIRPPPEIRAVADKTASYVAKNGRAFEARILGSGKGKTPKFAFLQPTSPFHAYYEERIRFYENGGEDKKEDEGKEKSDGTSEKDSKPSSDESKKPESSDGKDEPTKKKKKAEKGQKSGAAIDPVAKALLTQRGKIAQARAAFEESVKNEQPPQLTSDQSDGREPRKRHYTPPAPPPLELINIIAPSSLTLAQVETIQLVAQFTALDGKGGPFIGRLTHREWSNPAFAFCQPRHGHFAYFSALVDAYRRIYDTWTSSSASRGDMVEEMASSVDQCLELTAYRVEYERDLEEQTRKQKAEHGDEAQLAQIDWHDFVVVETIDFPKDEKVELAMLPPPPPPPKADLSAGNAASLPGAGSVEEMELSDDEDGETIRVVPSYKPKVVSARETNSLEEVIDPITGKSVPVKDMPEHMRIQLLDPKWAEERKKFQEKQKDSNLVSGDAIASNISRFSRDAYGKSVSHWFCGGHKLFAAI
jgi:splicing factor 3A subunit 1